jgi:hypothetical protein
MIAHTREKEREREREKTQKSFNGYYDDEAALIAHSDSGASTPSNANATIASVNASARVLCTLWPAP